MDPIEVQKIAKLFGDLELCHHKAACHVDLIIEAIGEGRTDKGYQGRETESQHLLFYTRRFHEP
jgi:hypothetical protein